jgi:plastocyanin
MFWKLSTELGDQMRRLRDPRILAATVVAVAATALLGGVALAGKSPPVSLDGKVSNKGEKTVKKSKITIEEDDFYFKPTFSKSKLGSTVKVTLKNEGNTQHTFTIPSLGIDNVLDAGKKATVDVRLPADGALGFYCRFHGEPRSGGQGMQGAFFSKKGEAVSTGGGAAPSSSAPPATTGAAPSTSAPSGPYGY